MGKGGEVKRNEEKKNSLCECLLLPQQTWEWVGGGGGMIGFISICRHPLTAFYLIYFTFFFCTCTLLPRERVCACVSFNLRQVQLSHCLKCYSVFPTSKVREISHFLILNGAHTWGTLLVELFVPLQYAYLNEEPSMWNFLQTTHKHAWDVPSLHLVVRPYMSNKPCPFFSLLDIAVITLSKHAGWK